MNSDIGRYDLPRTQKTTNNPTIYDYETPKSNPQAISANQINAYLTEGISIFLEKRSQPVCKVNPINKGSEATDFGHLFFTEQEKNDFLTLEPNAEKWKQMEK